MENKAKSFALELKQCLYLMQILQYNLEWIKQGEVCPSFVKVDVNGIMNAFNRLKSNLMVRAKPETWVGVKSELKDDQLHDISLVLFALQQVENIGVVAECINQSKETQIN